MQSDFTYKMLTKIVDYIKFIKFFFGLKCHYTTFEQKLERNNPAPTKFPLAIL